MADPVSETKVRRRNADQTDTARVRQRPTGFGYTVSTRKAEDTDPELERVLKGDFTKNQIVDPFATGFNNKTMGSFNTIQPPFNLAALLRMAMDNSVLKQCIEAMVTNISGHGYRLEYIGDEDHMESDAAKAEEKRIKAFMDYPNDEYSMNVLRRRIRWDLEATGNGYMEVARDRAGSITACWHIPAHLMRMCEADKEPTEVEVTLPRDGAKLTRKVQKHFRRYVQIKGAKTVYFKEFGDPRTLDPSTGEISNKVKFEDSATEIIHFTLYHAGHVYGIPRWINNVVAVQGSRQAELTNLDFFSENAIPAMAVMVSGGAVTQDSITAIENHFRAIRGRSASNRIIFIEALGDEDSASENGAVAPPKIELKSLSGERPQDGLFLDYDKKQTDKIRSSFRLPPIFIGMSEDYTRATAETSYDVAEGQVFGPDRVTEDDILNRKILSTMGLLYWEVRSNPPRITDPNSIMNAIRSFEASGAMTPNVVIGLANEMFDMDIEEIAEEWGNYPFSVVKNLVGKGEVKGWEGVYTPPALPAPVKPEKVKDPEEKDTVVPVTAPEGTTGDVPSADAATEETAKVVRRALMDLRRVMLASGSVKSTTTEAAEVTPQTAEIVPPRVRHRITLKRD